MVKPRERVNLAGRFEAEVQRILRQIPGLTVTPQPGSADRGIDAILTFSGGERHLAVEIKSRASAATAWQLVREEDRRKARIVQRAILASVANIAPSAPESTRPSTR